MEVYYDLSQSPATHDIVYFLARAEDLRIQNGHKDLQVRIVDGDRMMTPRDVLYTHERKQWRIHNLLVPVCRLLPSVTDVSMGLGKQTIPYSAIEKPRAAIFKSPEIARSIVVKAIETYANPVTISIRQTDFNAIRNSRMKEWLIVASWLLDNGYTPIFIPDIEAEIIGKSHEHDYPVYRAATYNHALRLALYELSVANLMTSGGFFGMSMLCDIPMMAFKLVTPNLGACTAEYLTRISITPAADWGQYKKLFWEQDTADFIIPQLEKHLPMFCERERPLHHDVYKLTQRVQ
jgi:hypothetical protein